MTKSDWQYLVFFALFVILFAGSIYAQIWLLAFVLGIFVLLFIVHLTLNLKSPPTVSEVLVLLNSVIDPHKNHETLNGDENDDYSQWQAFCDTPILNNRLLNRIRVDCYKLNDDTNGKYFQQKDNDDTLIITDDGIEIIKKFILEIENSTT